MQLSLFIFNDTLCIYDIKDRPDFKRAIFEIGIPFQVKAQKGVVYKGLISNIKRDIVLFMPNFQGNKFNLKLNITIPKKHECTGGAFVFLFSDTSILKLQAVNMFHSYYKVS